jgi:hypothetical protein
MKNKIIVVSSVLTFVVFAFAFSYAQYGKKAFDNTSASPDGKTYICRRYVEIDRVIAVNAKKKYQKKEIKDWSYDDKTGEIRIDKNKIPFEKSVFHVEGKPVDPPSFILYDYDSSQMPAFVFVNSRPAVENRDYVIDGKNLVLKNTGRKISSFCILWNTYNGASSIGEMTESEADIFAESEAAWFFENVKKNIMSENEKPELCFTEGADKPRIVMESITPAEKEGTLALLPVQTYKNRNTKNMRDLSREAGFKINFPDKVGKENTYKRVSALLIESAVKGEITKSVEASYSIEDMFSDQAITIMAEKEKNEENNELSNLIRSETMPLKYPVSKKLFWTVVTRGEAGTMQYTAERYCQYSWINNQVCYTIECSNDRSREVEQFIALLLKQ